MLPRILVVVMIALLNSGCAGMITSAVEPMVEENKKEIRHDLDARQAELNVRLDDIRRRQDEYYRRSAEFNKALLDLIKAQQNGETAVIHVPPTEPLPAPVSAPKAAPAITQAPPTSSASEMEVAPAKSPLRKRVETAAVAECTKLDGAQLYMLGFETQKLTKVECLQRVNRMLDKVFAEDNEADAKRTMIKSIRSFCVFIDGATLNKKEIKEDECINDLTTALSNAFQAR